MAPLYLQLPRTALADEERAEIVQKRCSCSILELQLFFFRYLENAPPTYLPTFCAATQFSPCITSMKDQLVQTSKTQIYTMWEASKHKFTLEGEDIHLCGLCHNRTNLHPLFKEFPDTPATVHMHFHVTYGIATVGQFSLFHKYTDCICSWSKFPNNNNKWHCIMLMISSWWYNNSNIMVYIISLWWKAKEILTPITKISTLKNLMNLLSSCNHGNDPVQIVRQQSNT